MHRRPTRKPRPATRFRPRVAALEGRLLLSADVLTYHNDNARDGLNSNETILTPQNVNANTFGLVGFNATDGKVDAEPLFMSNVTIPGQGTHDVLFVATEHDSVYAFDADTGATLWRVSMLGPGEVPSDPVHGSQVTPEIGVTATPVIDPNTGTMYVVAMSKRVSGGNTTYIQRIHALDVTTGADMMTPTTIGGPTNPIAFPGQGPGGDGTDVIFDPRQYKERDALLLVNGVVVTSWASHSDVSPYTSWVISFNASDLSLSSIINLDPNGTPNSPFLGDGSGNAFWNSGGGPAADDAGNFYNITGNGPFDPNLDANGFPRSQDYGDSYIKFSTDGGLAVSDYFTPFNQQQLANSDLDTGSSGIMLLPDMQDSNGNTVQLAIGSGKDGNIYLVDRNNMGQFHSGDNSNIYQEIPGAVGGQEFATPAYFNGQVYFGGVGATIRAYLFSNARLQTTQASHTSNTFAYPGATPSISSDGTTNGIVWAVNNTNPAVLFAYDANNLANELYDSNQAPNGRDHFGAGNKFITPMIANGKVFVATTNGVGVFGLLPDASPPTVDTPAAASPNPVEGTTTTLSVLGADVNFSESQLLYTWAATVVPPGAPDPTFSDNGTNTAKDTTVNFYQAGTYTFEVTIETPNYLTTTSDVTVTVDQTLAAIVVASDDATIADGDSLQFTATALDQFGNPLSDQPEVIWSFDPGGVGGKVTKTGLYKAPAAGTGGDTVRATSGPVSGAATVVVTDGSAVVDAPGWIVWDGRSEPVDVVEASTGVGLDRRTASSAGAGTSLAWNRRGHAQLRVASRAGNGAVDGMFFG